MATTQTILGNDQLKGPSPVSSLRTTRFAVRVAGAYAQAARPSVDVLAAIQAVHQGASAVSVKSVTLLDDGYNGATRLTAPNGNIALSGTGNKVVTFRFSDASTNGDAGAELADTTVVDTTVVFAVVHTTTY